MLPLLEGKHLSGYAAPAQSFEYFPSNSGIYDFFFFKYVVKSVPLSVINRTHDVMQKTFFMWLLDCQWSSYINNILAFKYILSNVFLNCLTDCKNRTKF